MTDNTSTTDLAAAAPDLMALIRLMADPKAAQARLDAFVAASTRMRDERAAAEKALAATTARSAELDKREAALVTVRSNLAVRSEAIEARHSELATVRQDLTKLENLLKRRIAHHAGALEGMDDKLRVLPTWAHIDELLGAPTDAHFESTDPAAVAAASRHSLAHRASRIY